MSKVYDSIFVAGLKIDQINYLTEILMRNYLHWLKRPVPNCPFWRKDIMENNKQLTDLGTKYQVEISEVKNLLKVFNEDTLVNYFLNKKPVMLKFLTKEKKSVVLYELYTLQLKLLKQEKVISKADSVTEYAMDMQEVSIGFVSKKRSKLGI